MCVPLLGYELRGTTQHPLTCYFQVCCCLSVPEALSQQTVLLRSGAYFKDVTCYVHKHLRLAAAPLRPWLVPLLGTSQHIHIRYLLRAGDSTITRSATAQTGAYCASLQVSYGLLVHYNLRIHHGSRIPGAPNSKLFSVNNKLPPTRAQQARPSTEYTLDPKCHGTR